MIVYHIYEASVDDLGQEETCPRINMMFSHLEYQSRNVPTDKNEEQSMFFCRPNALKQCKEQRLTLTDCVGSLPSPNRLNSGTEPSSMGSKPLLLNMLTAYDSKLPKRTHEKIKHSQFWSSKTKQEDSAKSQEAIYNRNYTMIV